MSGTALREPAILHIIFRELHQLDLLRLQSVCSTWRQVIQNNKTLLSVLFMHPGTPIPIRRGGTPGTAIRQGKYPETVINPLLESHFLCFFNCRLRTFDSFTEGYGNSGPWVTIVDPSWTSWTPDWKRLEKFMRPEASWRRMIPCWPPATQVQLHMQNETQGTVARLDFTNNAPQLECPSASSHPTWLTFGFIHDLIECAWFQGSPTRVRDIAIDYCLANPTGVRDIAIDYCLANPTGVHGIPKTARISDQVRESISPRTGRVSISFYTDAKSDEERQEQRDRAIKDNIARREKADRRFFNPCGHMGRLGRGHREYVYTTELHFPDAVCFDRVDWDDVFEYDIPAPNVPPTRHVIRRTRSRWRRCSVM